MAEVKIGAREAPAEPLIFDMPCFDMSRFPAAHPEVRPPVIPSPDGYVKKIDALTSLLNHGKSFVWYVRLFSEREEGLNSNENLS